MNEFKAFQFVITGWPDHCHTSQLANEICFFQSIKSEILSTTKRVWPGSGQSVLTNGKRLSLGLGGETDTVHVIGLKDLVFFVKRSVVLQKFTFVKL